MTILSDNPSSPICGEYSNNSTSESNLMLSSPMMITTSVVEQAALYYSPLLTAATCYSVLERNHEDNMIALDEGSNISAQSIHNNNHHDPKEDSMHFDEYIDECAQSINSDSNKPPQHHQHHPCSFMDIKDFTSVTHNQNGAKNLIEEKNSNCTPVYNETPINYPLINTPKTFNRTIDHHPPTFNKLCIPSHMTSVSTKNNKSLQINTLSNFQPSTQYKVFDQQHEHPLNHRKSTFCEEALSSPQCNDPFSYQHFQNNQFSLPDQNLLVIVPQEDPVNEQQMMIINNIDHHYQQTKKQDNSYAHEDSQQDNNDNITPLSGSAAYNSQNSSICTFTSGSGHHHQEEYRNCCRLLTRTAEQEENPATIDSQQEEEVFSSVLPFSTNNTKGRTSTTTMGNTIINHYFPNDVHPGLGFIEMLPNKYQQQQQNNNRLSSSFHHHQYAVNYDHHQAMMVNSPTMMKEMMVLDEKNMTTTLTHSSSHSSLTHLSRFNGDVKQFISGSATATTTDEPSLIDLPFEMILHIITFIPHQDNMCHEYNTYWNVREKYLKKLHTEAKQSVHNQFSKKRFVKNLMESTQTNRISISSKDDEMDDEYQYMSQTNYGIFSICFVNNYMYHNYFKNVHFWKLICESYFNIPRTDCLEPPVDKKLLNAIYSKQFNGASDCPTSKIAKLGDWLQGMLNISNASEFSNMAIDENMGSFQVTGAVQNSGSNANFFISNPPVQEELVWWQYSYHYLHSVPARFDLNPNYLLPIFQVSPKNACSEDSNMLNISGLAKENDITKNSVLYNTCISRLMETDNKKSPNDYRWRNATSEQIFTPNNLYYFEFYVEKIGGINLGVGIVPNIHFTGSDNTDVPNDFNPSHYDNFIWPSGSCHHCFEINNQRYYSGDVVGMLVDYSYSEKNVLKIHFCHNWNTKEKRKMLQNQLKKVAELETLCHNTGNFEQSVFSSLLEDEINNIRNGVKSKDNEDEDDINYPFKDNQVRLIYFTDDTQTQFPECVISEGRNELISFMKVNPATHNPTDKKKKEAPKKLDLQKERPQASHKDLTLPDFKLCVTTYDKEDSVRIIKPSYPHPPLYYHLLRNGRHTQQQTPANKPILSSTEEKELRKIIMDALGDCQYSSKNHHQHTNSSSSSNSSNSSSEERNKGCSIM